MFSVKASVVAGFSYSLTGKQSFLLIMGVLSSILKTTSGAGLAVNHNRFCPHPNPVGFDFTVVSQFLW